MKSLGFRGHSWPQLGPAHCLSGNWQGQCGHLPARLRASNRPRLLITSPDGRNFPSNCLLRGEDFGLVSNKVWQLFWIMKGSRNQLYLLHHSLNTESGNFSP